MRNAGDSEEFWREIKVEGEIERREETKERNSGESRNEGEDILMRRIMIQFNSENKE